MIKPVLPKILRMNGRRPELFPADPTNLPSTPGPSRQDLCEAYDLSYEDALLDTQISRSLHSEFGALQPPANSFHRLLAAIDGKRTARPAPPDTGLAGSIAPVWSFRRAAYGLITGPGVARLVPGGVALMLVLGVLGSDTTLLLPGNRGMHDLARPTPYTAGVSNRGASPGALQRAGAVSDFVYDAAALLRNDPPETLAPPRRNLPFAAIDQEDNSTPGEPRKE
jgi:hypothetical protein